MIQNLSSTVCIENVCDMSETSSSALNYLKCRVYPNPQSLDRCHFDLNTCQEYADEFLDTIDLHYGRRNEFVRRRQGKLVHQRTMWLGADISINSHCYGRDSSSLSLPNENLVPIVSYRFKRYLLLDPAVCEGFSVVLDELMDADSTEPLYSVITIGKRLNDLDDATISNELSNLEKFFSHFQAPAASVYDCFPAWSKFMFVAKLSANFERLESVFVDTVTASITDVILKLSKDIELCQKAKEYLWTVSYGINYFQEMIESGLEYCIARQLYTKRKNSLLSDKDVFFSQFEDL